MATEPNVLAFRKQQMLNKYTVNTICTMFLVLYTCDEILGLKFYTFYPLTIKSSSAGVSKVYDNFVGTALHLIVRKTSTKKTMAVSLVEVDTLFDFIFCKIK